MQRDEYWLFETAVEYRIPVPCLVHPELEVLFNKPSHRLNRRQLFTVLRSQFDRGYFIAHQESRGDFIPTDDELCSSLERVPINRRETSICYGLTAAGGRLWEGCVSPRWDRYICEAYADDDGEIRAADKHVVTEYLRTLPHVGIDICPESIAWASLTPWPATYWKTLPLGCRVQFQYRETGSVDWSLVPDAYHRLHVWYSPPDWPD
jgi:hypothetical protein